MSSPSPSPLGSQGTRRVSTNSFMNITNILANPSGSGQQQRALTPPLGQQQSPNSFLAGLSSRLISNKRVPQDMMDISGTLANSSGILSFRNTQMHNFGVVGGSVGGPPALDMSEFPSLGGHNTNPVIILIILIILTILII